MSPESGCSEIDSEQNFEFSKHSKWVYIISSHPFHPDHLSREQPRTVPFKEQPYLINQISWKYAEQEGVREAELGVSPFL